MKGSEPTRRPLLPWGPALLASRGIAALSRLLGRGGGTTAPGRALLAVRPDAIDRLARRMREGSVIVSATNGKTTTSAMISAILAANGRSVVHNRAGSNMHWGIATALATESGDEGLFEIDEAWLSRLTPQLMPRLLVLSNLFRDQLDRYGELESIASEWRSLVQDLPGNCDLVLCADDPRIAELGRDLPAGRVTYFGVADQSCGSASRRHAFDSMQCPACGRDFSYESYFVGHLGVYRCPECGLQRPTPSVAATSVTLRGMEGTDLVATTPSGDVSVHLPLPGLYNVYNALAAIATSVSLGIPLETCVAALEDVSAAFGRVERIAIDDRDLWILLIKNPAGANEVIRTLLEEAANVGGLDLWVALNDGIADGRDISWVWDADFEDLAADVRQVHCAGTRAAEMALRLKYAGWPEDRLSVEPDLALSLDASLASCSGRLFALPTYTALLQLRTMLSERGHAPEYWD